MILGQVGSRVVRLGVVAVALAVIGGCQSGEVDARPSPVTPTAVSPASASPSTTFTPTPMPAAAKQHTAAGAEAFVRFYFQRLNEGFTHPEIGSLSKLSQPSCTSCNNIAQRISQLRSNRHHIAPEPYLLGDVQPSPKSTSQQLVFEFTIVQQETQTFDADQKPVTTNARETHLLEILLLYKNNSWRVGDLATTNIEG